MAEEEHIDFTAKYRDWVSIRRMAIYGDTKPEEVAYHLAGIRGVADIKSAVFLGIDTAALDDYSLKVVGGSKKGYRNLADAIARMDSTEAKGVVSASCPDKSLVPVAQSYLLGKIILDSGYNASVSQSMLSKIYKHLKPPKGLGRGKKKG